MRIVGVIMARPQYSTKVIDIKRNDINTGLGFSVSTREELDVFLEIPAQSAIYIQGFTGSKQITMFARGYQLFNDAGNGGIEVDISLFQHCTSDTNGSDRVIFNLAHTDEMSEFKVHTDPQNIVLGEYRADLSGTVKTVNKEVSVSVDSSNEYIMPLNDKSIIMVENFGLDELLIAFNWQYVEKGV
jgi:hypothetical protein